MTDMRRLIKLVEETEPEWSHRNIEEYLRSLGMERAKIDIQNYPSLDKAFHIRAYKTPNGSMVAVVNTLYSIDGPDNSGGNIIKIVWTFEPGKTNVSMNAVNWRGLHHIVDKLLGIGKI